MGKRPRDEDMQELDDINARLTEQDKVLKEQSKTPEQMLWTLKGSGNFGLEGLMRGMEKMEETIEKMDASMRQIISDVAHLQRWKQRLQTGLVNLNVPTAVNSFFRFLGWIVATLIAIWAVSQK